MMYGADNGTTDKTNRNVKGPAGTSGQRVRKALPTRRSAVDGNVLSSSAPTCKAVDGGTASNVGSYLSDSIDDGDDDEIQSEEVLWNTCSSIIFRLGLGRLAVARVSLCVLA